MASEQNILSQVRSAAKKRILFLPHALRQMVRPDRMITTAEIRAVVERGEAIENYPGDPRGPSCLMLGEGKDSRAVHVVLAPREEFLAVITAYIPNEKEWLEDFKRRKTK